MPRPYEPTVPPLDRATFRRAVRNAALVATIERDAAGRRTSPRTPNQRPGWDAVSDAHRRLTNGRAGNLTPAQAYRSRQAERAGGAAR